MSAVNIKPKQTNPQATQVMRHDTIKANQEAVKRASLKGLLLNNHIKKENQESFDNFDKISTNLLIPEEVKPTQNSNEKTETFDMKKVLKPLLYVTGATLAGIGVVSVVLKKYSSTMLKKPDLIQPEDLARNMNIVEEPHFAMYRALREPNAKNILGLIGVGLMTGVTVAAKNFVDGAKEAWIKKQDCNINHQLQENLVSVETQAFSGKLNVVNTLLADTTKYFKAVLSDEKNADYKNYLSFKGDKKESNKEENKKNNYKAAALILGGAAVLVWLAFGVFKNYQKTVKNLDDFTEKMEDKKIRTEIEQALQNKDKESAIKRLSEIFKKTNAQEKAIRENAARIQEISEDEINSLVKEVNDAHTYSNADKAMYGTAGKIQYYCYINEERGHLYNWILNPENKFNKYLFISFSAISALGYILKAGAEAIKSAAVSKENSKSELDLRKKLVATEINNFKAKKMSAINPLLENFKLQVEKGKSKEELKALAENILIEIKTGPPYVYG